MGVQLQLNNHTAACRELGKVELHHQQGHASSEELEAARAAAHKTQAALILAFGSHPEVDDIDQYFHEHSDDCEHNEHNTVRTGLVVIESFIGEDGPVLHMTTNDGSGGTITGDHALNMMGAGVQMIIEELMKDD